MAKLSLKGSFRALTRFEWRLWVVSLVVVATSFLLSPTPDYLTLTASLVGVTALIFLAKGMILGQLLSVVFALLYGIVAFLNDYYGEVITYVCMTGPMSVVALVSWVRHPFKESNEVEVATVSRRHRLLLPLSAAVVTCAFYFLLGALGTASLWVSTLSVATSWVAVYLTWLRSPYYAIGYAANDVVLIVLWIMASLRDGSQLPMIFCFVMFLANDLYGFVNWRRMQHRQNKLKMEN